jgi:hypothetical protein
MGGGLHLLHPLAQELVIQYYTKAARVGILDHLLRLTALGLAVLFVTADRLPEDSAWGICHYTTLSLPVRLLMACLLVVLAAGPLNDAIRRGAANLWDRLPGRSRHHLWFAALALISGVLFWVLRIQHLRWGDAEFIVKALAYTGADRPIWTIYNWQAPLTIYLHAQLWLLLNPLIGVAVGTLYAITSVLAGVGFVYVLLCLSDCLGRDRLEKVTICALVATTGSIQLFFGYVENYTIMSTGVLLTLYLAVRCLRYEVSPTWPSLTLAVTNSFHPSTIVLWPALLYLGWWLSKNPAGHHNRRLAVWLHLTLPPVLVFLGLAVFMTAGGHSPMAMLQDDRPGGADGIPFVPLFTVTTEWQHYTMFSLAHMIEWANEHFLISPFGLVLLLGACARLIIRQTRSRTPGQPAGDVDGGSTAFLTIASLAYLVLTFVWNPDYGMRKDWDLFAPSAFVYTLLAATVWVRSRASEAPARRLSLARTATLVIVASALHTAGWVHYNTFPW